MAKNRKYLIKGLISIAVGGGEMMKAGKDGLFELTEAEAKHLAEVYLVEDVETGAAVGKGTANVPGATKKTTISRETLMALTNEQLDDRVKALGLKSGKDDSKGDKAEAILAFIDKLDKVK